MKHQEITRTEPTFLATLRCYYNIFLDEHRIFLLYFI